MDEKLPNLVRKQTSKSRKHRVLNKRTQRLIPRHIIIKRSKVKDNERILKSVREKQLFMYKATAISYLADI